MRGAAGTDVYGTDHRRVRHPGMPGRRDVGADGTRPRAVVVGAGIAGLAAATGLAERGFLVTVIEREHYLGGRVGGWTERLPDGTTVGMNRGFHAFFAQYYNLRKLLIRSDPELGSLRRLDDYPLIDADGRRDHFRQLPRTPPWNALVFALRSPTFSLRDLIAIDARAAAPLAAVSVPRIYERLDHIDADTFLHDINFPSAARHLAFEVFSRSFFTEPRHMSAAELATMFHIYFLGSSEGLIFDVARDNFDTSLWAPLASYLTVADVHGRPGRVEFRTGVSVTSIDPRGPRTLRVRADDGAVIDADAVVAAADITGLRHIVAASPNLGDMQWRSRIAASSTAPPFAVLRLWLDRPLHPDRAPFLATGGLDPLDNVSVLDRYEHQAAVWARRTGGGVVELHAYALSGTESDLHRRLLTRLHQLYPETAAARIVADIMLWRQDCPRLGPGGFAQRPTVATPHPRLMLAGDGIRVDLPVALMERAATTGWLAANALLRQWGAAEHTLQTVPTRGRSSLLHALGSRKGAIG